VEVERGVELLLGREHLAGVGLVRELVEVIATAGELSEQRLLVDVVRGFGHGAERASRTKRATGRLHSFARSVTVAISAGVQRTSVGLVRGSDVGGVMC
jgi:hypothetical protein